MTNTGSRGLKMLNVGCGRHFHPDWVNIDIAPSDPRVIAHNVLDKIPFPEESFDVVYHSSVLEHLPKWSAPDFIAECYRVLVPGGVLRVGIPDLETICRLYLHHLERALAGEPGAADRYDWMLMELLDQMVRDESGGEMLRFWKQRPVPAKDFVIERVGSIAGNYIASLASQPLSDKPETREALSPVDVGRFRQAGEVHKWMYDRFSLARLLTAQGFVEPNVRPAAESAIPGFSSYGLDLETDGRVRKPDSLFMEAVKPDSDGTRS
jgi:SAM-dependent methyltransferase